MPKITSISSRSLRSYDPLSCLSLEDSKAINHTLFVDTSFIWEDESAQKYHHYNQDTLFLQEAISRTTGRHRLQTPLIDHFRAQGRTIYTASYENRNQKPVTDTYIDLDSTIVPDFLTIISNMLSLLPELPETTPEQHTPPRRRSANPHRKIQSSRSSNHRTSSLENTDPFDPSISNSDLPAPRTFFLAITEDNQVELIPETVILRTETDFEQAECTSDPFGAPDTPDCSMDEEFESISRCSTPALTSCDSVNSSPRADPTDGWDAGIGGPTRARIDPINYGTVAVKPTASGFSPRFDFEEPELEETEREESLGDLFDLYINTEDCENI